LQELDEYGSPIYNISLLGKNVTAYESTNSNGTTWTYDTVLDNKANATIIIQHFPSAIDVSFANSTIHLAPDTLKLSIRISNWPFQSGTHSLGVVFDAHDEANSGQPCNVEQNEDANNSLESIVITINGTSLYGQFFPQAIIDGRIRVVSFRWNQDATVTAIIPHFWQDMEMDPDFSVLLGSKRQDNCSASAESSDVSTTVYIAVFVSLGLALLIALAVGIMFPRLRLKWQVHMKRKSLEMDEIIDTPRQH